MHSDPDDSKRQEDQPHERIEHEGYERERPRDNKQDTPEKEREHSVPVEIRSDFRLCSHRGTVAVYADSVKSYRKELWFEIPSRCGFVNITQEVESCLAASGIREGLALINAMHITASVFINDDEAGLHQDYEKWLEKLAPHEPVSSYRHNQTGEDNADAHMKRQIMGREVVVAVTQGHLDFGPWEQIFYGEFDGRRPKRVLMKIIGE